VPTVEELLVSGLTHPFRPAYSGAVAIIQRGGTTVGSAAVGETARFADTTGAPAPEALRRPVELDTIFDLASITKLFVTTVVLSLVDEGRLGLDEPVATWLPSFHATPQRRRVTVRHLLTHTSGLPALLQLWTDWPDRPARVRAILDAPLRAEPGRTFEYSCVGFIVVGLLASAVTDQPLPDLVRERVTGPLGMRDTGYLPGPEALARCAATAYQPTAGRGLVHGAVHDENSWSLGGVAGNAGIFGTAPDLVRFGDLLLGRGPSGIISDAMLTELSRDQLPADIDPGFRHGLGVRIGDRDSMGGLTAAGAFGHTGFTGTSLVVDRTRDLIAVLLTNRVHPSRDWSDIAGLRCGVANLAACA
jgi:CubicO group peptidase (beta-lactamase class C family)